MLALALAATLSAVPPCPAADAGAVTADALAWLAGSWSGDDQGTLNEEAWTAPSGGLLLAVHRDVRQGKAVGFEFLRIEAVGGRLTYRAMPGGQPATDFTLVEHGAGCVAFQRAGTDFPQRVRYWREGEVLHASIEGLRGGKPASKAWAWTRAAGGPAAGGAGGASGAGAPGAAQAPMTPPPSAAGGKEPGPTDTDPDKYTVAFENEKVRVLRYHDVPGARTRPHRHVDSLLSAGSAFSRRLVFPDGTSRERTFKAGDLMWVPAQSHIGENVGSTDTEVLLVECKGP